MKKILYVFIVLMCFVFAFSGCSEKEKNQSTVNTTTEYTVSESTADVSTKDSTNVFTTSENYQTKNESEQQKIEPSGQSDSFKQTTELTTEENYDDIKHLYSRAYVARRKSGVMFGRGRNDDEYVALNFVYSNDELADKYGDDFEVEPENVICNNSEGNSYFILGLYSAEAKYSFVFEDEVFAVYLSKDTFGKWKVVSSGYENIKENRKGKLI